MSFWLSPALIRTGDTLRGNTGPRFFSRLHQFCVKDYGFICLGCLVRRQPLTGGVLQNVICMLIPSQGVWRNGPFSVTATGPTLDTVSDLGAAASQLLIALQTGPRPALTGRVCGERLGPDAALTPVPSSMLFTFRCWQVLKKRVQKKRGVWIPPVPDRRKKLTMPELNTSARPRGLPGLPRTDWSLTTADQASPESRGRDVNNLKTTFIHI